MNCKASEVSTCSNPVKRIILGYCHKHYRQYKRNGHVLKSTRYDKRDLIVDGEIVKIPLELNASKGYAVVDKKYIDLVWGNFGMITGGYVMRYDDRKRLHHIILEPKEGMLVDHRNGDKLDNRESNLRLATKAENNRNVGKKNGNRYKNPFKGVYKIANSEKYSAAITYNYKQIKLGRFTDAIDAARAYDKAAVKYFGEFARLNNV